MFNYSLETHLRPVFRSHPRNPNRKVRYGLTKRHIITSGTRSAILAILEAVVRSGSTRHDKQDYIGASCTDLCGSLTCWQ